MIPIEKRKTPNTSTASSFTGWPIIDPSDGIIARILRYLQSFWQTASPQVEIEAINLTNEADFKTFEKYVNDSFIPTLTLAEKKFEKLETASELGTYYEDLFKLRAMQQTIDGYQKANTSHDYTIIKEPYQKVDALAKRLREHLLNQHRELSTENVHQPTPPISAPGLDNQGNGCFANSLFQVLFNVPFLRKWVLEAPFEKTSQNLLPYREKLNGCIWKYQEAQRSRKRDLGIASDFREAVQTISNTPFNDKNQHDVTEFLLEMLGVLEKKDNPLFYQLNNLVEIQDYSNKQHQMHEDAKKEFPNGKKIKKDWEPGYASLPIQEGKVLPISTLIDRYMNEKETIDDYTVCHINLHSRLSVSVQKKRRLLSPPQFLSIGFNRFKNNGSSTSKINDKVYIEPEFYLEGRHFSEDRKNGAKYRIRGFVHQTGSLSEGHYTSCFWSKGTTWIYCNDSSTRSIEEKSEEFKSLLQTSYLLFAECIDHDVNSATVSKAIESEKERAEDLSFSERVRRAALKKDLEREIALLGLFNENLMLKAVEGKDLEHLLCCFDKLEQKTKEFFKMVLTQAKLWEEKDLKEQLLKLKQVELKLNSVVTGNIVAQYVYILEQRNQLAALDKKVIAQWGDQLAQTLQSIEKTEGHLKYLIDCLTALKKVEDNNHFSELLGVYHIDKEFATFRKKYGETLEKSIEEARKAMLEQANEKLKKLGSVKKVDKKCAEEERALREKFQQDLKLIQTNRLKQVLEAWKKVPQDL